MTIVAASSAALLVRPALAEHGGSHRRKTAAPPPKPLPPATGAAAAHKEFERQRASTLATLKTLREYPLPPGGDLPVVFRPQRSRGRER